LLDLAGASTRTGTDRGVPNWPCPPRRAPWRYACRTRSTGTGRSERTRACRTVL